jgi:hypothetical protein
MPLVILEYQHSSSLAQLPNAGKGRLILEVPTSNTQTSKDGRTPLDERSARRTDLYLTTHNTHNRQISKLPAGFEPEIPASERPQTLALDRSATGIGSLNIGYIDYESPFVNIL